MFDGPGEYEVSDISVIGIAARAHMDDEKAAMPPCSSWSPAISAYWSPATSILNLDEDQLEDIGMVDAAGRTGRRQRLHRGSGRRHEAYQSYRAQTGRADALRR